MYSETVPEKAPAILHSRDLLHGHVNGKQLSDKTLARRAKIAQANGVDTEGKIYLSQLADRPNDPTAWVRDAFDVEAVCRAKGMRCHGVVDVDDEYDPVPREETVLGEDLIADMARRMIKEDPSWLHRPRRELYEAAKEKGTPRWRK